MVAKITRKFNLFSYVIRMQYISHANANLRDYRHWFEISIANDYTISVTGGCVYNLPRGIRRAAFESKSGFPPISPSTVSEQV